jgi:hypothetical protein
VITDYFISPDCPVLGTERYNGAQIARHADYQRDAEIVVCADQRVPRGWRRLEPVEDPGLDFLCPTSKPNTPLAERVMRIRRQ